MKKEVFKNLRDAVKDTRKCVAAEVVNETKLPISSNNWPVYDSELNVGNNAYGKVFPFERSNEIPHIGAYIERYLQLKKGEAVGMDIGGIGSQLFSEFSQDFFKSTIGIVLTDSRSNTQQSIDLGRHHDVIVADVFSSSGWNKVRHAVKGTGVDCILERMLGGWRSAPQHSLNFLYIILNRWYQLLNNPGIMFIEVPRPLYASDARKRELFLYEWCERFKKNINNGAVAGVAFDFSYSDSFYIRLEKGPGAPENLPTFKELQKLG